MEIIGYFGIGNPAGKYDLTSDPQPVSYTHLDVYKRQPVLDFTVKPMSRTMSRIFRQQINRVKFGTVLLPAFFQMCIRDRYRLLLIIIS